MNNIKPIFFWSDLHIGHQKSLEFDNRPFKDLDHMHRVLINNYNSTVPTNGICYFLGDIGLSKGGVVKSVIEQMHGTRVCIRGNHDAGINSLYSIGFDVVLDSASLVIASELVTMSHYPLPGIVREATAGMRGYIEGDCWHGESKRKHLLVPNVGQYHLHGHIHSPNKGKSIKILGNQYDVGVVANNYRPISISVIESWIGLSKRL